MDVSTKGRTSLNSLVGTGSKRQVVGLEEETVVVSSDLWEKNCPDKSQLLMLIPSLLHWVKYQCQKWEGGAAREPYVTILHQTNDWAKLRCKVPETLPQPHVQWRDSAGNTLTESQGSGEIILDVTVTKTDYYSCVATQDDALSHQTQSEIYVYIHDLFLKDRRAENPGAAPRPYVVILDQTKDWSLLQCEVQGASLQPDVQWQDSDGNTLTAEKPQVTTDGERYDVIINVKVTKTDTYRCVVTQKEIGHQIKSGIYVHINGSVRPVGLIIVVTLLVVAVAVLLLLVLRAKGYIRCNKENQTPQNNEFKMVNTHET